MLHNHHVKSYEDLITPYEETRAGFISFLYHLSVFKLPKRQKKYILLLREFTRMENLKGSVISLANIHRTDRLYLHV